MMMSTKAAICVRLNDNQVMVSNVWYDGYPSYAGVNLINHFTDKNKVTELVKLGTLDHVGTDLSYERGTHALVRDQLQGGDPFYSAPHLVTTTNKVTLKSLVTTLKSVAQDYDFTYLFFKDVWYLWYDGKFVKLEGHLHVDHAC